MSISTETSNSCFKYNRQAKNSSKISFCQVCGDRANIFNYGALCCQSCKTFFRRNISLRNNLRPCLLKKNCQITMTTRRACTECRLAKCLSVGMSEDFIRKDIQIQKNTKKITNKQIVPINSFQTPIFTLDLLNSNRSSLNSSEWTLVSNIIHAHDRFSAIPFVRNQLEQISSSNTPSVFNESNVFENVARMYLSINAFLSSIPDFQVLTTNEQQTLFERNFHGVLSLFSIIFLRSIGIFQYPTFLEIQKKVYGDEMVNKGRQISGHLEPDETILKIFLIIVTFSSNCFIVDLNSVIKNDTFIYGTFRLMGSQNVYVELLWKYMIYRYGHQATTQRFSKLICSFLTIIRCCTEIYIENNDHQHLVNGVVRQIQDSLIINQDEHVSLWGK